MPSEQQSPGYQENQQNVWYLYGKAYELSPFMKQHPGGEDVLKRCANYHTDLTPVFEIHHAFSNIDALRKTLQKFEIKGLKGKEEQYTFEKDGFYETLRLRVRECIMPGVNRSTFRIKADKVFWTKMAVQVVALFYFFMKIFFAQEHSVWHYPLTFVLGVFYMSVGFNALHDASHFALFPVNTPWFKYNDHACRLLTAMILGKHEMWTAHHIFRHHIDTGNVEYDPDTFCFQVYTKKNPKCVLHSYMRFVGSVMKLITFVMIIFFPGILYGQIIIYWATFKEKIDFMWYEVVTMAFLMFCQIYRQNIYISLLFFMGINFGYCLCVLPNHDTWESMINNDNQAKDWGEIQVRSSGNFSNYVWNNIYHHFFGGINFQIEHHLFPSLSHVHFPTISPIVRQTCKEFNIPYSEHDSLYEAIKSTFTQFFRETDKWDRDYRQDELPAEYGKWVQKVKEEGVRQYNMNGERVFENTVLETESQSSTTSNDKVDQQLINEKTKKIQ